MLVICFWCLFGPWKRISDRAQKHQARKNDIEAKCHCVCILNFKLRSVTESGFAEEKGGAAVWLGGMSDPYERVKGGRLAFKGGSLATRSKSIDKKNKKKKKKSKDKDPSHENQEETLDMLKDGEGEGEVSEYTIDAAKRMKYEQLFPVESKKFGYEPKTSFKSVEDALDDRVKKKADRYCK
ncbi:hypothetical protein VNO77_00008 [Canavalia gladiata]|uniref:Uncharacterized protein n=1 Tax=Canavalia gladiata TaxID=3824 RepID=A0AAN9MTU9_CANGL